MLRIFNSLVIKEQLSEVELRDLSSDFRTYKETGILPSTFGRDALYDHINNSSIVKSEELRHLHLRGQDDPWPIYALQYQRTSDVHMVYCQGFHQKNHFLLMSILAPNAHEQARQRGLMYKLGSMAENFRNKY